MTFPRITIFSLLLHLRADRPPHHVEEGRQCAEGLQEKHDPSEEEDRKGPLL